MNDFNANREPLTSFNDETEEGANFNNHTEAALEVFRDEMGGLLDDGVDSIGVTLAAGMVAVEATYLTAIQREADFLQVVAALDALFQDMRDHAVQVHALYRATKIAEAATKAINA